MGLGGCIVLIAGGAILTFATDWDLKGVNVDLVGIILMAVGLIGIAVFSSVARRRRVMLPPTETVIEEEDPRHLSGHRYVDGRGYDTGYR